MGFFSQLTKAVIDLAALPVSVARDAVSLGGVADGRDESYSSETLRKVGAATRRAYDALDSEGVEDRERMRR